MRKIYQKIISLSLSLSLSLFIFLSLAACSRLCETTIIDDYSNIFDTVKSIKINIAR